MATTLHHQDPCWKSHGGGLQTTANQSSLDLFCSGLSCWRSAFSFFCSWVCSRRWCSWAKPRQEDETFRGFLQRPFRPFHRDRECPTEPAHAPHLTSSDESGSRLPSEIYPSPCIDAHCCCLFRHVGDIYHCFFPNTSSQALKIIFWPYIYMKLPELCQKCNIWIKISMLHEQKMTLVLSARFHKSTSWCMLAKDDGIECSVQSTVYSQ